MTETEKWLYRIILTHILPVMWLSSLYRLLFTQSNCFLRPVLFCWSTIRLHKTHANIFLVYGGLFDTKNWSKSDWKNFFSFTCCKSYVKKLRNAWFGPVYVYVCERGWGGGCPPIPRDIITLVLFVLCTAQWAESLGWTLGPCPAFFACIQCRVRTTGPKGFWRLWQFCFRTTGSGALGLLDCV